MTARGGRRPRGVGGLIPAAAALQRLVGGLVAFAVFASSSAFSATAATAATAAPARTAATAIPYGSSATETVERPATTHTALPLARDLAPQPGVRHLVLFSVTRCPWCEIVRAKHLRFRVDARQAGLRIAVSEVRIDRDDKLVGPEGQPTTARALAHQLGVRFGPTVMAFDGAGKPVGEPIVGALLEDFYEGFLDRLVEQAAADAAPAGR